MSNVTGFRLIMKKIMCTLMLSCSVFSFGQIQYYHTSLDYRDIKDLNFDTPIYSLYQKNTFPKDTIDVLELEQNGISASLSGDSYFYLFNRDRQVLVSHDIDQKLGIIRSDTNYYENKCLVHKVTTNLLTYMSKDSTWYSYKSGPTELRCNNKGQVISLENYSDMYFQRQIILCTYDDTLPKKIVKLIVAPQFAEDPLGYGLGKPVSNYIELKKFRVVKTLDKVKYHFKFNKDECSQQVNILYTKKKSHPKTHIVTGSKSQSSNIRTTYKKINGVWKPIKTIISHSGFTRKMNWVYEADQVTVHSVSETKNYINVLKEDIHGNMISSKLDEYDGKNLVKTTLLEFRYTYDNHHNWIKKSIFQNGMLKEIIEREIIYYNE